jgi:hypothetical protein
MYPFIILILFLLMISFKEGYLNYQELSVPSKLSGPSEPSVPPKLSEENNCPQIHADNYQIIKNSYQMIQPFGYTKNDLFHMTRFTKTDVPLPTDPDFFKHI